MTRSRTCAILLAALPLAGCAGRSKAHTSRPVTSSLGELLSAPAVGRIYGRCKPGDPRWTIEFVAGQTATDTITYRIGSGRSRTVSTNPRVQALTWRLVPNRFRSPDAADPTIRFPATSIKTTEPLFLDITQGTEPHFYRVKVKFAVAASIGDTTACALVSSRLTATTYYTDGQPPG